jgi:potassium channel subfamily K
MTILISDMGDTVVDKFKKSSDQFADFTVLPKNGIWRKYLDKHPWLVTWLRSFQAKKAIRRRLKTGFETTDPDAAPDALEEDSRNPNQNNITDSEKQHNNITSTTPPPVPALPEDRPQDPDPATASSTHLLYHRLALNINRVVADLHSPSMNPKRYDYEEWVEFTRLIHHTTHAASISLDNDDGEEGLLEWDWIGTDSPLMSGLSEPQWVLGRLCESMDRLYRSERRREVGAEGRERVTRRREVNGGGGIVGGFTTDRDDGEVEMGLEMEGFRVDDDRVSGQAMS